MLNPKRREIRPGCLEYPRCETVRYLGVRYYILGPKPRRMSSLTIQVLSNRNTLVHRKIPDSKPFTGPVARQLSFARLCRSCWIVARRFLFLAAICLGTCESPRTWSTRRGGLFSYVFCGKIPGLSSGPVEQRLLGRRRASRHGGELARTEYVVVGM